MCAELLTRLLPFSVSFSKFSWSWSLTGLTIAVDISLSASDLSVEVAGLVAALPWFFLFSRQARLDIGTCRVRVQSTSFTRFPQCILSVLRLFSFEVRVQDCAIQAGDAGRLLARDVHLTGRLGRRLVVKLCTSRTRVDVEELGNPTSAIQFLQRALPSSAFELDFDFSIDTVEAGHSCAFLARDVRLVGSLGKVGIVTSIHFSELSCGDVSIRNPLSSSATFCVGSRAIRGDVGPVIVEVNSPGISPRLIESMVTMETLVSELDIFDVAVRNPAVRLDADWVIELEDLYLGKRARGQLMVSMGNVRLSGTSGAFTLGHIGIKVREDAILMDLSDGLTISGDAEVGLQVLSPYSVALINALSRRFTMAIPSVILVDAGVAITEFVLAVEGGVQQVSLSAVSVDALRVVGFQVTSSDKRIRAQIVSVESEKVSEMTRTLIKCFQIALAAALFAFPAFTSSTGELAVESVFAQEEGGSQLFCSNFLLCTGHESLENARAGFLSVRDWRINLFDAATAVGTDADGELSWANEEAFASLRIPQCKLEVVDLMSLASKSPTFEALQTAVPLQIPLGYFLEVRECCVRVCQDGETLRSSVSDVVLEGNSFSRPKLNCGFVELDDADLAVSVHKVHVAGGSTLSLDSVACRVDTLRPAHVATFTSLCMLLGVTTVDVDHCSIIIGDSPKVGLTLTAAGVSLNLANDATQVRVTSFEARRSSSDSRVLLSSMNAARLLLRSDSLGVTADVQVSLSEITTLLDGSCAVQQMFGILASDRKLSVQYTGRISAESLMTETRCEGLIRFADDFVELALTAQSTVSVARWLSEPVTCSVDCLVAFSENRVAVTIEQLSVLNQPVAEVELAEVLLLATTVTEFLQNLDEGGVELQLRGQVSVVETSVISVSSGAALHQVLFEPFACEVAVKRGFAEATFPALCVSASRVDEVTGSQEAWLDKLSLRADLVRGDSEWNLGVVQSDKACRLALTPELVRDMFRFLRCEPRRQRRLDVVNATLKSLEVVMENVSMRVDPLGRSSIGFSPGIEVSIACHSGTASEPEDAFERSCIFLNPVDGGFHSNGDFLVEVAVSGDVSELYVAPNFRVDSFMETPVTVVLDQECIDAVLWSRDGELSSSRGELEIPPGARVGFTGFSRSFQLEMSGVRSEVFEFDAELGVSRQTPHGSRLGSLREFARRSFAFPSVSRSVVERTLLIGDSNHISVRAISILGGFHVTVRPILSAKNLLPCDLRLRLELPGGSQHIVPILMGRTASLLSAGARTLSVGITATFFRCWSSSLPVGSPVFKLKYSPCSGFERAIEVHAVWNSDENSVSFFSPIVLISRYPELEVNPVDEAGFLVPLVEEGTWLLSGSPGEMELRLAEGDPSISTHSSQAPLSPVIASVLAIDVPNAGGFEALRSSNCALTLWVDSLEGPTHEVSLLPPTVIVNDSQWDLSIWNGKAQQLQLESGSRADWGLENFRFRVSTTDWSCPVMISSEGPFGVKLARFDGAEAVEVGVELRKVRGIVYVILSERPALVAKNEASSLVAVHVDGVVVEPDAVLPLFAPNPWVKDFSVTLVVAFPSGRERSVVIPIGGFREDEVLVTSPGCAPVSVQASIESTLKTRTLTVLPYHTDAWIGRVFSRDSDVLPVRAKRTVRGNLLLHCSAVDVVVVAALSGGPRREVAIMRLGDVTLRTNPVWAGDGSSGVAEVDIDWSAENVQIDHSERGVVLANLQSRALEVAGSIRNIGSCGADVDSVVLRPGRFEATFDTEIAQEFFEFLSLCDLVSQCPFSVEAAPLGPYRGFTLGGSPFSLDVVTPPTRPFFLRIGEISLEPLTARVWCEILISSFPFLSSELKSICKMCTLSSRLILEGVRMELCVGKTLEGFQGSVCEAGHFIIKRVRKCVLSNLARIVHRSNLLNVFGGKLWNRRKSQEKTGLSFRRVVYNGRISFE